MHNISKLVDFLNKTGYANYPDTSRVKRVLIIHLKNIGDMVLSEPIIRIINASLSPDIIDFILYEGTEPVLARNPFVSECIVIKRKESTRNIRKRIFEEIRLYYNVIRKKYDLVVVLNNGSRVSRILTLIRPVISVGPHVGNRTNYIYKAKMPRYGKHYIDRHKDILKRIGIFDHNNLLPRIYDDPKSKSDMLSFVDNIGISDLENAIIVHPTSRWMFKTVPPAAILELVLNLRKKVHNEIIVTSGPDHIEMQYIEQIQLSNMQGVYDISGKLSLSMIAELLRSSAVLVCVDTALLHMAEAVNTPVVALFGPTNEVDWGIRRDDSHIVTNAEYKCRPCGNDGCGGSKVSDCLVSLDCNEVVSRVLLTLNSQGSK